MLRRLGRNWGWTRMSSGLGIDSSGARRQMRHTAGQRKRPLVERRAEAEEAQGEKEETSSQCRV
jgi:hypothetical protein